LLSGLAKLPIKQGIAVTGSVNQKGEVQAIGGINEKIEGYFELCKLIGLNGEQGVMIPSSNARQLMLKEDILEAVRLQKFKIWTVDTIDDGIEILTGIRAGTIEEEGTVNGMVNKVLKGFSERMKLFVADGEDESAKQNGQVHWVSDIASQ
jgi:predicted ATP-dependent protease